MRDDPTPRNAQEWDHELPDRWYARRGRRLFDWALLVLLLSPALLVMGVVALCNLLVFGDPRQVLFTQTRVGWRNRPFRIYKFRTMRETRTSEHGSWATGADRLRVTRFGRLLRNTHLDELPQMFNILRGEMSFIGPRPEMVEIESWVLSRLPEFSCRLALRPGITGLAQITQGYTGRDVDAYARKLEINAEYMRQVSLVTDLSIVLRTIAWMLRGKGWAWNRTQQPAAPVEQPRDSEPGQRTLDRGRRRAG